MDGSLTGDWYYDALDNNVWYTYHGINATLETVNTSYIRGNTFSDFDINYYNKMRHNGSSVCCNSYR